VPAALNLDGSILNRHYSRFLVRFVPCRYSMGFRSGITTTDDVGRPHLRTGVEYEMLSDLSEDDIRALRGLLDRVERASPAGSVSVVVRADADDRFSLSPEDENGAMGMATSLPDCRGRFDYTSTDLAMEIKDLDVWPAEIAVIAQ